MAGYNGYAMSNNAVSAYENGEKPISKWTKADILYELKKVNPEIVELAKKLTVSELKCRLLKWSSWHHTSSKFNQTDFYSFDEIEAESFTEKDINKIIAARPPKATRTEKSTPEFITAYVAFDVWDKNRFGRVTGKHEQREAVQYRSNEKLVKTSVGVKRLSSLTILYTITQKTKYASKERVLKNYKNAIDKAEKAEKAERKAAKEKRERLYNNVLKKYGEHYAKMISRYDWMSRSGKIYINGKKPDPIDYEEGLDKFFKKGDLRMSPIEKDGNIVDYILQYWDGTRFINK